MGDKNKRFSFQKLIVYQKAIEYADECYNLLEKFPQDEKYAICSQLKRACVSVPSNIAEGMSRQTPKDQIHFLDIAYGSLMETLCQFEISTNRGYMAEDDYDRISEKIFEVYKLLAGLKSSIQKRLSGN